MILGNVVCTDPELLRLMILLKNFLYLLMIIIPIGLIILMSIDVLKGVSGGNQDDITAKIKTIPRRLTTALVIFLVPTFINLLVGIVDEEFEYASCFSNASTSKIQEILTLRAEEALILAEEKVMNVYLKEALVYINKIENEELKSALFERTKAVAEQVAVKEREDFLAQYDGPVVSLREDAYKDIEGSGEGPVGSGTAEFNGYYTDGKVASAKPGGVNGSEPNPAAAINYWIDQSALYNEGDFIYPKAKNGQSLGAWPKNYADYPAQLTNSKTYIGGAFIFPNTPYKSELEENKGIYNYVYEHNGIDFISPIGKPVYSPVNGTLVYSEWGHTRNKGTVETSYTVTIAMDAPATVNGKQVSSIFLTHLSGITNRCARGECNKKVKQGELIGFIGWANAGHLHMTVYPGSDYNSGIYTSGIEALYNIPNKSNNYKIEAGG